MPSPCYQGFGSVVGVRLLHSNLCLAQEMTWNSCWNALRGHPVEDTWKKLQGALQKFEVVSRQTRSS